MSQECLVYIYISRACDFGLALFLFYATVFITVFVLVVEWTGLQLETHKFSKWQCLDQADKLNLKLQILPLSSPPIQVGQFQYFMRPKKASAGIHAEGENKWQILKKINPFTTTTDFIRLLLVADFIRLLLVVVFKQS